MRVAYFDAISGAAGDMFLGALLDAGLDLDQLRAELEKLPIGEYTLSAEKVQKRAISATQFLVQAEDDGHTHDHHHEPAGRSLGQILELIDRSALDFRVREQAAAIFSTVGAAESHIHDVPLDEVHFHEVGEIDSIVDIVGASIGLSLLGIDTVYCSPLPLGSGTIRTHHGIFPNPAPATLQILARAGAPTRPGLEGMEQVTPTGAAILSTVARFEQPSMRVEAVGYGAGEANLSIPNVLRVWIGEVDTNLGSERLTVIQTNIDDMQPELLAHVADRCMAGGALDVSLVPVTMKKGRLGTKVEVLSAPKQVQPLVNLLLRETTTLGVRTFPVDRYRADRSIVEVETPYGALPVKVKAIGGVPISAAPEYEACRARAAEVNVPLIDVYQAALVAGQSLLGERS